MSLILVVEHYKLLDIYIYLSNVIETINNIFALSRCNDTMISYN